MTERLRWPLDVVKLWDGWGSGDNMNTIIRYLLEETSTYENIYTNYLHTRGSDYRMVNGNFRKNEDVGRELGSFKSIILAQLSQVDQSNSAHRLLVGDEIKKKSDSLKIFITERMDCIYIHASDILGKISESSGE